MINHQDSSKNTHMKRFLLAIILVFSIQNINAQVQDSERAKRYFDRTYYTEAIQLYENIVTNDASIIANMSENGMVWNPLPALGGMEPETMEEAKQLAPSAFRTQERAVTPSDYEEFAKRVSSDIQHTATTFRWTTAKGSNGACYRKRTSCFSNG